MYKPVFKDRAAAGQMLAQKLERYRAEHPIVLGLPRGGVVVGYEIAQALDTTLDIMVARKLGAPGQPELGIGAVAPGGVILLDQHAIEASGYADDQINEIVARERAEMRRRIRSYRGDDELDVRDKTVILVDDGLATGVTALAAVRSLRQMHPRRIILAVGVCPEQTANVLRSEVDDFICGASPEPFHAVGIWFEQFDQNTDEEVIDLLDRARERIG